jgi:peptidoglycan/LPS O-acetylase OafA/YrhL
MSDQLLLMYGVWLVSSISDTATDLLIATGILTAVGALAACVFGSDNEGALDGQTAALMRRAAKPLLIVMALLTVVVTVLPTKKDMLFIVGGAGALAVVSDPQMQGTARAALEWVGRHLEADRPSSN